MKQELLTLLEHVRSPPIFSGIRVLPGFIWCRGHKFATVLESCYSIFSFICMFCRSCFVLFLLTIVLSVLLRYTDSDCPYGIFKLFSVTIWNVHDSTIFTMHQCIILCFNLEKKNPGINPRYSSSGRKRYDENRRLKSLKLNNFNLVVVFCQCK